MMQLPFYWARIQNRQRGTVATDATHNPYPNWLRELLSFLCVINQMTWESYLKNSPCMVMNKFSYLRKPSVGFNLKNKTITTLYVVLGKSVAFECDEI